MERIDGLILTFVLNALWQVPAVLAAGLLGDLVLRRAPARQRHGLWLAVVVACLALPAASLLESGRPAPDASEARPATSPAPPGVDGMNGLDWLRADAGREAPFPSKLGSAVMLLYGLSLAFHATRLAGAWRQACRLARGAHPLEIPADIAPEVSRCRAALGTGEVEILGSPEVAGPVTLGARRPLILLPCRFFAASSPAETVAALGHEMAHVRRRDYAVNLLGEVLLLPVAFHPAVRMVRRRLAETREMACDEAALETLVGPRVYARSLLSLAAAVAGLPRPSTTLGVLDAHTLEVRMKRILDLRPRMGVRRARASLGAALLLLAGIGSAAAAFSVRAVAADPAADGLGPFVGTWNGDWPLTLPGEAKPRRALDLEIQPTGEIVQTWYRYEEAPDGSLKVDKAKRPALSFKISGQTLTFTTRVEDFKFRDEPPAPIEIEGSIELQSAGEAVFRIISHSYFAAAKQRGEPVPPPPPPLPMKRVS